MTIIIAGERSGVGKTTITLAILAYLRDRAPKSAHSPSLDSEIGHGQDDARPIVQSFKVGPDYIDPMFHTYVTGRGCRNLDPILTSEEYVRQCFAQHCRGTDYAIVEGVMGLFDGASGVDDTASTAHIARLLDVPIVLVLDCGRISRSIAAIMHGYTTFDPRLTVAGVILNRVGSDRHLQLLTSAIEPLNIPVLGVLRREKAIALPDRHLGLIPTDELPAIEAVVQDLGAIAAASLNWALLLPLLSPSSCPTPTPPAPDPPTRTKSAKIPEICGPTPKSTIHNPKSQIRIAIARDRAFNFYYPDNFDILEELGATLIFWSPLTEPALPDNVHGLYFGGGFPEIFAADLANNASAQASVKAAITAGLPTYAECGGLMYLCESIIDFDGTQHPMVGIIPSTVQMGKRLSLGYRHAIAQAPTVLVETGQIVWGHEFHRSHLTDSNPSALYELYGYGTPDETNHHHSREGWSCFNVHASYVHLHWGSQRHIPQRFLSHCHTRGLAQWSEKRQSHRPNYSDPLR